jgi:hypothetical protein
MSCFSQAFEDPLAVLGVGLVAGRAQGRRRRAGDGVERRLVLVGQVDELVVGQPAHAVPHAEDPLDRVARLAGALGEQALDDPDERLVDDGGRAARLADDGVAWRALLPPPSSRPSPVR